MGESEFEAMLLGVEQPLEVVGCAMSTNSKSRLISATLDGGGCGVMVSSSRIKTSRDS